MSRIERHFRGINRSICLARVGLCGILAVIAVTPIQARSDVLEELGCAGCHQLEPIPRAERTIARFAARKGPDLFYAGSKYRPEWLRSWLADPKSIRPAGIRPFELTSSSETGDVLAAAPAPHPTVPSNRIDSVVAALESRDWGSELLPNPAPAPAQVPRMLAELNFVKFKGCGSCHRTTASGPPLSGPDLMDGWSRLQPAFLAAYIANPQNWDPVAPMPGYALQPIEVGKLMEYLRLLSQEAR